MSKQSVIIIGSGFGGLSAAIRLAAKGHRVTLFEKRDQLGGRAYQYEINGFRFDGGPTVITAPYMFDELFAIAGRRRTDYLDFTPLDPFYRIFDHTGRHFDYWRDEAQTVKEIERWNPTDVAGYQALNQQIGAIFDKFYPYTEKPFQHLTDLLKLLPDIVRLRAFMGTYSFIGSAIRDDFLRRVFSFHPLLIGGNPFDTPSIFTLIMQFEKNWGVHYARGGTGAIVRALGRLLEELGVDLRLQAEVSEILVQGRRVAGVRLADGTKQYADAVVCNSEVVHTYRHLIAARHRRVYPNWRLDLMKQSLSLFVIYFGTKRRYLETPLQHHNIIINRNYKALLGDVFGARRLPDELALYLHMPSRTDPTIAPAGCESFYVLSLVPNLAAHIDWKATAKSYRDRVMQFLEANYLPDLQANIIAEHSIDPLHFRDTLNSYRGAAFSLEPLLLQSAWFRPHNRSEEFSNLYFVGAGTHPGAGVPAVLASGKIAAELIDPTPLPVTTKELAIA